MTASLRYGDDAGQRDGDYRSSARLPCRMAHAEEDRKALGQRLAEARRAAGFTMEGAAKVLTERGYPITKQGIGHWESGRNIPDALWLTILARLYGAPPNTLTGFGDDAAWPFPRVERQRILALSPEDRGHVQARLLQGLEECKADGRLKTKVMPDAIQPLEPPVRRKQKRTG